jgi:hypothetical protein
VAFLAAKSLHIRYGHALNACGGEGLFHFFKLERFDNGNDEFHREIDDYIFQL